MNTVVDKKTKQKTQKVKLILTLLLDSKLYSVRQPVCFSVSWCRSLGSAAYPTNASPYKCGTISE